MQGLSSYDPRALAVWNNPNGQAPSFAEQDPAQNPYVGDIGKRLLQALLGHPTDFSGQPLPLGFPQDPNTESAAPNNAAPEATPPDNGDGGDVAIQASRLHQGLLGGFFRTGHTGGNILGILGDALLAQAGRPAVYAPRLEQSREREALQGFQDDPLAATQRVMGINLGHGTALYDKVTEQQAAQAAAQAAAANRARLEAAQAERNRTIYRNRGLSLIASGSHDPRTAAAAYPELLARARRYWQGVGFDPAADGIDLPETYDAERVSSAVRSGMTPAQIVGADQREEDFGLRRQDAASRAEASLAERRRARQSVDEDRNWRRQETAGQHHLDNERPMTEEEVAAYGFPAGTRGAVNGHGQVRVLFRPRRGRARPLRRGTPDFNWGNQ